MLNELVQATMLDKFFYFILKLDAIFDAVTLIVMIEAIFIEIPLIEVGLQLHRSWDLILDLHKHLDSNSIQRDVICESPRWRHTSIPLRVVSLSRVS